ncbi:MAG: hypothetical protein C4583_03495 [Anaerolineaceae bacterium]|nr:MAG: hypothetical protein C4583_03495 [Anaerolineaceae bacterium]
MSLQDYIWIFETRVHEFFTKNIKHKNLFFVKIHHVGSSIVRIVPLTYTTVSAVNAAADCNTSDFELKHVPHK